MQFCFSDLLVLKLKTHPWVFSFINVVFLVWLVNIGSKLLILARGKRDVTSCQTQCASMQEIYQDSCYYDCQITGDDSVSDVVVDI